LMRVVDIVWTDVRLICPMSIGIDGENIHEH
jgi:hypothetical protein